MGRITREQNFSQQHEVANRRCSAILSLKVPEQSSTPSANASIQGWTYNYPNDWMELDTPHYSSRAVVDNWVGHELPSVSQTWQVTRLWRKVP
jgi:hypothetical protein